MKKLDKAVNTAGLGTVIVAIVVIILICAVQGASHLINYGGDAGMIAAPFLVIGLAFVCVKLVKWYFDKTINNNPTSKDQPK